MTKWLTATTPELLMVVLCCAITYTAILVYTRLTGLRSFSKMSASDFAMTVAVGSLFASTISSPDPSLALGLTALAGLFMGQWLLAVLRTRVSWVGKLVDNEPLLLMSGPEILEDNLRQANVSRADLYGKLREANVLNFDQVVAVVFETTGDISVLHSDDPGARVDREILETVIDRDRLAAPANGDQPATR